MPQQASPERVNDLHMLRVMTIAGTSMHPLLQPGDRVLVRLPEPGEMPARGDIVAFAHGGAEPLVLHRVMKVSRGGILTRGDNSRTPEGPWPTEFLVGCLVAVRLRDSGTWKPLPRFADRCGRALSPAPLRLRRLGGHLIRSLLARRKGPAPGDSRLPPEVCLASGSADFPPWIETQQLGREVFVINTRTDDAAVVNRTALAIWRLHRSGLTEDQIVSELVEKFDPVSPRDVIKDVAEALTRMRLLVGSFEPEEKSAL